MRRKLLTAFILFLLTACTAQTPAPTATLPPAPTETATMIVAETKTPVLPTNTPEPTSPPKVETRLNPIYETPLVEIVNDQGATIKVKVITDATLDPVITALKIHEGWKNREGLTSEQALAKFAAMSVYCVAVENNGYVGTYEEYMADLAKAQESGLLEDWRKVQIAAKVDDWGTQEYDARATTMFPFYVDKGMEVPDEKVFREIDFAAVKVKSSNTDKILEVGKYEVISGDYGFGTSLTPDGILHGIVGIPTATMSSTRPGFKVGQYMSLWADSLCRGTANVIRMGYYENEKLMQILVSNVDNAHSESAFDDN